MGSNLQPTAHTRDGETELTKTHLSPSVPVTISACLTGQGSLVSPWWWSLLRRNAPFLCFFFYLHSFLKIATVTHSLSKMMLNLHCTICKEHNITFSGRLNKKISVINISMHCKQEKWLEKLYANNNQVSWAFLNYEIKNKELHM